MHGGSINSPNAGIHQAPSQHHLHPWSPDMQHGRVNMEVLMVNAVKHSSHVKSLTVNSTKAAAQTNNPSQSSTFSYIFLSTTAADQ